MNKSSLFRWMAGCGLLSAVVGGMAPNQAQAQYPDPFGDRAVLGPPVRIISPANHAQFYTPVDIPIFAYTRTEVKFTNVEFYANGSNLGPGLRLSSTNRPVYQTFAPPGVMGPGVLGRLGELWCFVWSNAPVGNFNLTAVADGWQVYYPVPGMLNRTSAPVSISVTNSSTGSNATDVVSIVATDPIAIAGTNIFWVWPGVTNSVPSWTNWPPPRWGYFTNWGPKPALFTVRRFGDASSNLTVNYRIGGTASNGVDYVALPGSVNIPAGGAIALIPIVPIDSGSNNAARTVVLSLKPSTNTPPDYVVGFPPTAEAIILHHWPRPWPWPWILADGTFHYNATGPDGAWFTVQSSPDLVNWSNLATGQAFQGSVDFSDPNASGASARFYRVTPVNGSP